MSNVNCNVTPGKVFTPDAEGKVPVTPDGLNLLGQPTVTATLDNAVDTEDLKADAVATAKIADAAVTTAKIADENVTQAKIAPASLDQTVVKVLADQAVLGGIPVMFRVDVANGTAQLDYDIVLTKKTRIVDAYYVKTTGANNASGSVTVLVLDGSSNTIAGMAMATTQADTTIQRTSVINDAYHEIAAGGTLRIRRPANAGSAPNVACIVYVVGISVA